MRVNYPHTPPTDVEDGSCCQPPLQWLPLFGCILITFEEVAASINKKKCEARGAKLYEEEDPAKLLAFAKVFEYIPGVIKGLCCDVVIHGTNLKQNFDASRGNSLWPRTFG